MNVFIYLIPITIFIVLIGICAMIWSLKNDRFDNSEGEKILFISERSKDFD